MAFSKKTRETFSEIKSLRVQGAENVARAAVQALASQAKDSKAKSAREFIQELEKTASFLSTSRPTEPAMRNELSAIIRATSTDAKRGARALELKKLVLQKAVAYEKYADAAKGAIAGNGAKLVPNRGAVFVHCHSSSVMACLKLAFRQGRRFRVFCTESRPFFQGRISAKELSAFGIPVTMIVDDSALFFLKREKGEKIVFVGADAITSRGELVNKIGTSMMALSAKEAGAKFYSCTMLHKYDPETSKGKSEPIEFRDERELLSDLPARERRAFSKIKLLNPAFDATAPEFITAFVTETGALPPKKTVEAARKLF